MAPVIAAGQAVLVDGKDGVASLLGDEFQLYPLVGHTPGHTGLLIASGNSRALLIGDALHSPIQILHPEWGTAGDVDPQMAEHTRRHIIETYTDSRRFADDRTLSGAVGRPPRLGRRRSAVSLRIAGAQAAKSGFTDRQAAIRSGQQKTRVAASSGRIGNIAGSAGRR